MGKMEGEDGGLRGRMGEGENGGGRGRMEAEGEEGWGKA